MRNTPWFVAAAACVGLLVIPTVASAHKATIQCDLERPGSYVVTPDYLHLNPVTTFGPTGATVTWSDRYVVTLPYPTGCTPHPAPEPQFTPAPPEQPATPQVLPAPVPVVGPAPAPVEPMPRKKAAPRKPVTCRYLLTHRAGKWSYIRAGFYPQCRAPKPPRKGRPYTPAVTG